MPFNEPTYAARISETKAHEPLEEPYATGPSNDGPRSWMPAGGEGVFPFPSGGLARVCLLPVFSDDGNSAHILMGEPAQIVRQTVTGIFQLAIAGTLQELEVHLVNHP